MITRECRGGPYVVQCDECTDTEELEGNEILEAAEDAKSRGFTAFRVGERKWNHHCAYCTKQKQAAA